MEERLGQDGEEESTRLSGSGLSAGHEVTAAHDDGNRVLLNGSRNLVVREEDVLDQNVVERGAGEFEDRIGNIVTRRLDGNVVVKPEVDARLLLRGVVGDAEELTLKVGVVGGGSMLSVDPLANARAPATTTTPSTAVSTTTTESAAATSIATTATPASAVGAALGGRVVGGRGTRGPVGAAAAGGGTRGVSGVGARSEVSNLVGIAQGRLD
ncbi:hypothetical protein IMZ48_21500 [Candidatus Bathyarchaeota archaeon]|nr:hypothetical protein [Candidatus Bathyarchaeota archaeon]